ncbi:hypothetical protein VB776_07935 [Arcicella sp. DC2W]|uniref:Uncharacterized protein n=1 Tax=Arcicella gelida TaxID=2984195 RepID=A0ABU5S328_9BACT|nr:hypothetical protein [Arcicella sp. DC2W]MEA5402840.1 hypothetical protein [Arcicella sp. DC2W]
MFRITNKTTTFGSTKTITKNTKSTTKLSHISELGAILGRP